MMKLTAPVFLVKEVQTRNQMTSSSDRPSPESSGLMGASAPV